MEYQGPEPTDLTNVTALNRAFLDWLRAKGREAVSVSYLPAPAAAALTALDHAQLERLARAPFLLMSLSEHDDERWRSLFAERQNLDLLSQVEPRDDEAKRLIAAGLGFLWQLSQRNPYAARLVSGASLNWCEELAASTLMELFSRVTDETSILAPRMADHAELWDKLLTSGVSTRRDVRIAARVSALQTVLTCDSTPAYRRLASAACKMPAPTTRVAKRIRR